MLTVKKINKYKTVLPEKSAFSIETDDDFIKMHAMISVVAKRGGGKSVNISNLIKKSKEMGYIDRVWLITPTYSSNKEIWNIASIEEQDVFEPTKHVLKAIIAAGEQEVKDWQAFQKAKALYDKFYLDVNIKRKDLNKLPPDLLIEYFEGGFLNPIKPKKPVWKYLNEVPPRLCLLVDDSLGMPLISCPSAGLTALAIAHRHQFDGLGLSLILMLQSYTARGGLDKVIRTNCTVLMLFKIHDEKQIKKIREESDIPCSEEEFLALCNYAFSIPYNFLLIDFSPKTECRRFRSGFDTYLHIPSIPCLCKSNKSNKINKNIKM